VTCRRLIALTLVLGIAGSAIAHAPTVESILGALNAPKARAAFGVTHAERDRANPRVLVVRVGAPWFDLAGEERLLQARIWREDWRRAVPQGVVAVLDARSDAPVIGFRPRGTIVLRDPRGAP
jgi:hypothetical protein